MVIDIEGAFVDYFTSEMSSIVGTGNEVIEIHRTEFPDDSQVEGVSIFAELRKSHMTIYDFEFAAVRIIGRTSNKEHTFWLMQNIDDLIGEVYHRNLNSTVELSECHRNSGPDFFLGANDNFNYGQIFYTITVRNRS